MNPAGMRILGAASPEQLIGVSPLTIVHPDFHESFTARVHDLESNTDRVPWIEQKYVRLDGTVIDVEVSGVRFIVRGNARDPDDIPGHHRAETGGSSGSSAWRSTIHSPGCRTVRCSTTG